MNFMKFNLAVSWAYFSSEHFQYHGHWFQASYQFPNLV